MIRIDLEDRELLVARTSGGVFVADAWCTHQRSDLTMGVLEGDRVRCALHQALFRLGDGEPLEGPSGEPPSIIPRLRVYKAVIEGGDVYAEI